MYGDNIVIRKGDFVYVHVYRSTSMKSKSKLEYRYLGIVDHIYDNKTENLLNESPIVTGWGDKNTDVLIAVTPIVGFDHKLSFHWDLIAGDKLVDLKGEDIEHIDPHCMSLVTEEDMEKYKSKLIEAIDGFKKINSLFHERLIYK